MKTGITHGGRFHADEVMATALLKIVFPEINVVRVNDMTEVSSPIEEETIVYDIGGGEFDHHRIEKRLWPDGTPASSAGLVWWKYQDKILDEIVSAYQDRNAVKAEIDWLIKSIDAIDNGVFDPENKVFSWSSFIIQFNPDWNEPEQTDKQFKTAVFWSSYLIHNIAFGAQQVDWGTVKEHFVDKLRKNGIRPHTVYSRVRGAYYGTCGDVWQKYGYGLLRRNYGIPETNAYRGVKMVDLKLIQTLDRRNNEESGQYAFSRALMFFNTSEVCDIIEAALARCCHKTAAIIKAEPLVNSAIRNAKNGVMVLESFVPWQGALKRSDCPAAGSIFAVVFPSLRGGYHGNAIPGKAVFPKEWTTMEKEDLKERFGVNFCHDGRFLIGADTKDAAIAACKYCEVLQ